MKIVMYAHGGSGNHGCEAIVRSTVGLLDNVIEEKPLLVTAAPAEDKRYEIDKLCSLLKDKTEIKKASLGFVKAYLNLKLGKNADAMDALLYKNGVVCAKKGDIALSIGGDNYCYKNVKHYIMLHDQYKKRRCKTVLWGCSVEPELLKNKQIAADIARYDLITAREPYSYEALKAVNPNTIKVADPAFTLNTAKVTLPKTFIKGNTVGINISPMIIDNETAAGIAFDNYLELCKYILKETDMSIALIPHVVWEDGDDRKPLKKLYDELNDKERVCLIDDGGCEELKGYIAACKFFVAARTHASIAAYSSLVPTLVVGYSIKAKGIATDLFGTDEGYVLPVQGLNSVGTLTESFKKLTLKEKYTKEALMSTVPSYKKTAVLASDALRTLKEKA